MTNTHSHHIDLDQPTRRRHDQRARSAARQAATGRLTAGDRPTPVRRQRPSHAPTSGRIPRALPLVSSDELAGSNGRPDLLLTFLTAILAVTAAVWLAAAVNQWWILIPVMAVDLLATAAVIASLFRLLSDG